MVVATQPPLLEQSLSLGKSNLFLWLFSCCYADDSLQPFSPHVLTMRRMMAKTSWVERPKTQKNHLMCWATAPLLFFSCDVVTTPLLHLFYHPAHFFSASSFFLQHFHITRHHNSSLRSFPNLILIQLVPPLYFQMHSTDPFQLSPAFNWSLPFPNRYTHWRLRIIRVGNTLFWVFVGHFFSILLVKKIKFPPNIFQLSPCLHPRKTFYFFCYKSWSRTTIFSLLQP